MRVKAQDGGNPPKSATATAKVEILRNFNEPRFEPQDYTQTILETQGLGVSILKVTAKDADTKAPYNVIKYSMPSSVPSNIKDYFEVDPDTGIVFLKKSLMLDSANTKTYGVCNVKLVFHHHVSTVLNIHLFDLAQPETTLYQAHVLQQENCTWRLFWQTTF